MSTSIELLLIFLNFQREQDKKDFGWFIWKNKICSIVSFSLPRLLYLLAFIHSVLPVWIATSLLCNGLQHHLFMGSCKKYYREVAYTFYPVVPNCNTSCNQYYSKTRKLTLAQFTGLIQMSSALQVFVCLCMYVVLCMCSFIRIHVSNNN